MRRFTQIVFLFLITLWNSNSLYVSSIFFVIVFSFILHLRMFLFSSFFFLFLLVFLYNFLHKQSSYSHRIYFFFCVLLGYTVDTVEDVFHFKFNAFCYYYCYCCCCFFLYFLNVISAIFFFFVTLKISMTYEER